METWLIASEKTKTCKFGEGSAPIKSENQVIIYKAPDLHQNVKFCEGFSAKKKS